MERFEFSWFSIFVKKILLTNADRNTCLALAMKPQLDIAGRSANVFVEDILSMESHHSISFFFGDKEAFACSKIMKLSLALVVFSICLSRFCVAELACLGLVIKAVGLGDAFYAFHWSTAAMFFNEPNRLSSRDFGVICVHFVVKRTLLEIPVDSIC